MIIFWLNMEENNIDVQALEMLDSIMEEQHKEIPENSPTLLMSETTTRFSGAMWYDKIREQRVMLAGVGGIGSWVALLLSRLDIADLFLFDNDTVETVNMAGQFFTRHSIGNNKAQAVRSLINDFSYFFRASSFGRYAANSSTSDIMVCGFDNMEARKIFYRNWKRHVVNKPTVESRKLCLFIDGRLNAEEFQILAIQGDDLASMTEYEKNWLFDDSEVEEAICSYKQTSFMANMIASYMVNIFVNFVANQCDPVFPRDIPFFTSYSADTMFTKMNM